MFCAPIPQASKETEHPESQSEKDIDRVIRNVVVIKFSHTHPFEGDPAGVSEATGFVVDAKRGYVLTNRHVAGPGPFWGSCIFGGQEEASCQPLYIDPVHDFAFLQYGPENIQNIKLQGLDLSPDGAYVGQPVRVVGNDAGEAKNIIDGTISRTDRDAPEYDEPYNDFNINYYLANMNLSGGISGSPALSEDGLVLGMVSGGATNGAICYLLPTGPILKTLRRLRQGHEVPRGDIQCQFLTKPLHECKGLGLDSSWESRLRQRITDSGGLLVANTVLAGGPSSGKILPGDILLEINGAVVLDFDELEDIFNESVDDKVSVSLLRGGELILAIIDVVNLHHITPKCLVSFGGLSCHDLSYVQAVKNSVPVSGVYVAESSEPLMIGDGEPGWIIKKLDGEAVYNLEGFLGLLKTFHRGQGVAVTYAHLESLHRRRTSVITLDVPSGITVLSQDGTTGSWRSATISLHQPAQPTVAQILSTDKISSRVRLPAIIDNLVHVESRAYLYLDGCPAMLARGMAVIVDAEAGLAVVSRRVVPHKACYITLTLSSSTEVQARCLFLHAHHCYAIIQYDVSLAPSHVAGVKLDDQRVHNGSKARLVCFTDPERLLQRDATVRSVTVTGLTRQPNTSYLRCHPVNADLLGIDAHSEVKRTDGVLVSSDGSIQAICMPGIGGLPASSVSAVLSRFRRDSVPALHVIPAEIEEVSTRHARILGVPEGFIRSVEESARTPHIFKVKRTFSEVLMEDDIFLKVNDKSATEWADFDMHDPRTISVRVWRQYATLDLELQSIRVDDLETTRCVEFCGAYIQPTPLAIRHGLDPDHDHPRVAYINHVRPGSTADLSSLPSKAFITKINGVAMRDFDAFVAMANELSDDRISTVTTVTLGGRETICVLQSNRELHPFVEWAFNGTEFVNKT